jgi:hypothetical protein
MKMIKKLFKNEEGATAIEYGLIAALIAVAAITAMSSSRRQPVEHLQRREQRTRRLIRQVRLIRPDQTSEENGAGTIWFPPFFVQFPNDALTNWRPIVDSESFTVTNL